MYGCKAVDFAAFSMFFPIFILVVSETLSYQFLLSLSYKLV